MNIDPRRGAAFLAAIDSGSLEQAAIVLHITPSAVSQRISALEDDLGMPLLVRTRPCRATAPGMRLLQFLRRRALLEAEFATDLDADAGPLKVALAVNNDTLATWQLPVLTPILIAENMLVDLVPDDQGHTFALLEQGRAVACIGGTAEPMRGCSVSPLGQMRYRMVAAPCFVQRWFPEGINREAARHAPVMVFDHKDQLQTNFLSQHFGLHAGDYPFHFVPASDPYVQAILLGLGYGMLPQERCAAFLTGGALVDVTPGLHVDVPLYWHAWKIQPVRLERMGAQLIAAARQVLFPLG
ncbi:MAG: LysR family transcriptional regulator ArgP [Pseudomonadota bacterium]|nr:LysR family transcriptional regulator ArgP [Pseudomonadota bacterium]